MAFVTAGHISKGHCLVHAVKRVRLVAHEQLAKVSNEESHIAEAHCLEHVANLVCLVESLAYPGTLVESLVYTVTLVGSCLLP